MNAVLHMINSIVGVDIWGRENIPVSVIYADTESVRKVSKSKVTQMSQESKMSRESKNGCSDDDDSSYSPSDGSDSEEEGDNVASQSGVENVALELNTPLWINANGFITNKMRSKSVTNVLCEFTVLVLDR